MTIIIHIFSMAVAILMMAGLCWIAKQAAMRPGLILGVGAGAYIVWRLYAWS